MKAKLVGKSFVYSSLSFFALAIFLFIVSCQSSDDPPTQTSQTSDGSEISVPLSAHIDNVQITAGQQTDISFLYTLPAGAKNYDTITVNLQDTINAGNVVTAGLSNPLLKKILALLTPSANASSMAYLTARIGSSSDLAIVCNDGAAYGPFVISVDDSNDPVSVEPATVTANPSTVQLINAGAFTICLQITSPVSGSLSASDLKVNREGCTQEPADFNGTWSGTYTCTNTGCPDDIDVPITLTVNQTGSSANYTAEIGASYSGTVCGNTFKFDGGLDGYFTESGTLVLNSDGTATKHATWSDVSQICSGTCVDQLSR
ncbi:MAG: hypothetical protein KKE17_11000 [Proteobacteria bacterium]|nr:hypothetical protein [Pseudomonadota bacterium]MBU1710520.1 hypothetical protein [Pseudomonadota bacterium]